jgi:hypothetical protein
MSDEIPFDLFAALEQRGAELKSLAGLFAGFRKELVDEGFSTDAAEIIACSFAETFITNGYEIDADEEPEV